MEIIIHTKGGKAEPLLTAINQKIEDGELKTWELKRSNQPGLLYNHIPEQWSEKVMLQSTARDKVLKISTVWWSKNPEPAEATKGYILGRFVEILMVHFRKHFDLLEVKP